ncbi:hypothetical protein L2E82_28199 [Cichorium intybus]|uniref:Uncharacterized protein n=1 Tax=Cichorium intybus TaxID=13427 RepID=A0ACB9CV31_CICIN|nr:hypothetical protein L2E82_28199 [Cichorium intybus]
MKSIDSRMLVVAGCRLTHVVMYILYSNCIIIYMNRESCIPVIENDESDKGNGDEVVDLNIDLNEEQGEQMMDDVEQRENMMEDVEEYTVEFDNTTINEWDVHEEPTHSMEIPPTSTYKMILLWSSIHSMLMKSQIVCRLMKIAEQKQRRMGRLTIVKTVETMTS